MPSVYDEIGGATALRALVGRFYDLVETDPRGAVMLGQHLRGHGIAHVREEQFAFLSGFLGGPRLFAERHGHMNLRELHDHLPIRPQEAEDWLALMDQAIADNGLAGGAIERARPALRRAALMLVNREADAGTELEAAQASDR
ncbi:MULTISPECIES: cyanoglobin [unclassified Paracoccus (in: a-proteobacteria)]|uniref:globin domain-containing protein n=1 Tax=unclassified Paracoccus (in: a-proteobacteria) TaxID=2688777 RepID=UPI0016039A4A|nr:MULTISPECIES: cyanoglobin [unclassified Paracoccus (in: a-proteobacteria)]MBB1489948.1 cyanoglobin [Paracoccus sp. MC1854]MBB1499433.1 cyanoglobin [Paracoccus sp. MC1862]QQO43564.1 cyanoglobin [Paracoccus sp. MC1862]